MEEEQKESGRKERNKLRWGEEEEEKVEKVFLKREAKVRLKGK